MQVELRRNALHTVSRIDILDQSDLVASRTTLSRHDGRVGKEVLPDLDTHVSCIHKEIICEDLL